MDFEIQEFEDFITSRKNRRAKSTLENYACALRKYEEYLIERDIQVEEVTGRQMDTFYGWLTADVSKSTAGQYVGNIAQFYDWLFIDSDRENPSYKIQEDSVQSDPEHSKPTLKEEEVRDLIESADSMRGKALLSLMASTGMRLREACESKLSNLDLDNRELSIMTVKTDFGERTVYYDRKTRRYLNEYIHNGYRDKYHNPDSDYIFIASNTNQYSSEECISTDVGRRIFQRALENSDIEQKYEEMADGRQRATMSTHILRRSFCQNWINSNGDIMSLRNIVGWKNLETAKEYISDDTSVDKRDRYGITL